jgi:hypothetical protein
MCCGDVGFYFGDGEDGIFLRGWQFLIGFFPIEVVVLPEKPWYGTRNEARFRFFVG